MKKNASQLRIGRFKNATSPKLIYSLGVVTESQKEFFLIDRELKFIWEAKVLRFIQRILKKK